MKLRCTVEAINYNSSFPSAQPRDISKSFQKASLAGWLSVDFLWEGSRRSASLVCRGVLPGRIPIWGFQIFRLLRPARTALCNVTGYRYERSWSLHRHDSCYTFFHLQRWGKAHSASSLVSQQQPMCISLKPERWEDRSCVRTCPRAPGSPRAEGRRAAAAKLSILCPRLYIQGKGFPKAKCPSVAALTHSPHW